jgi:predicted nucleic acid-binding protein
MDSVLITARLRYQLDTNICSDEIKALPGRCWRALIATPVPWRSRLAAHARSEGLTLVNNNTLRAFVGVMGLLLES